MIFQRATYEDIDEISALYSAAIGTDGCTWSFDYPNADITREDYERGDLFCLKTDEGEITGAISVDDDPMVEELICWSEQLHPSAELARLVVKESHQNQGVARMLLAAAMKELTNRKYKGVHYLVSPENERALRSYAKLNFRYCGECDLYGQHWMCFEKELQGME